MSQSSTTCKRAGSQLPLRLQLLPRLLLPPRLLRGQASFARAAAAAAVARLLKVLLQQQQQLLLLLQHLPGAMWWLPRGCSAT
jgi:hypothetical protein